MTEWELSPHPKQLPEDIQIWPALRGLSRSDSDFGMSLGFSRVQRREERTSARFEGFHPRYHMYEEDRDNLECERGVALA
jgi:hypothetical protein